MLLIVNVIGIGRKSGKTSLIEVLTKGLTERKYKVSIIKHISKGSFDTTQKDTWKHLQAGAIEVTAISPNEVVTIQRINEPLLDTAIEKMRKDVDLILVEGFKNSPYPKIIAAQSIEEAKELMKEVKGVFAISGPIVDKVQAKSFKGCPILKADEIIQKVEGIILQRGQ